MTAPRRSRTKRGAARRAPVSRRGGAFHFLSEIPVAGRHHDGARPFFLPAPPPGPPSNPGLLLPSGRPKRTTVAGAAVLGWTGRCAGGVFRLFGIGESLARSTAPSTRRSLTQSAVPRKRGSPGGGQRQPSKKTRRRRRGGPTGGGAAERDGVAGQALPGGKRGKRWDGAQGPPPGLAQGRPPPDFSSVQKKRAGNRTWRSGPSYYLPWLSATQERSREPNAPTRPAKGRAATEKIAPSRRAPRRPRAACPR